MNARKSRAIRREAADRRAYRALKRAAHKDQGQQPKALSLRKRKAREPSKPTWPATADQKQQSRPVIVLRPVRSICFNLKNRRQRKAMEAKGEILPKWRLDQLAIRMPEYL